MAINLDGRSGVSTVVRVGLSLLGVVAVLSPLSLRAQAIYVEAGNRAAFGTFSAYDATVSISEGTVNPFGSIEFAINERFSIGAYVATVGNRFDLEFENDRKVLDGQLSVSRRDILPFVRLGHIDGTNVRVGFRNFRYEFTDGDLNEFVKSGSRTRVYTDAQAEGAFARGVDAELNLRNSGRMQFGVTLGAAFFPGGEYSWRYNEVGVGPANGSLTTNTLSARAEPNVGYMITPGLRIFANYRIEATSWLVDENGEGEQYAGQDIMTGLGFGLRYAPRGPR